MFKPVQISLSKADRLAARKPIIPLRLRLRSFANKASCLLCVIRQALLCYSTSKDFNVLLSDKFTGDVRDVRSMRHGQLWPLSRISEAERHAQPQTHNLNSICLRQPEKSFHRMNMNATDARYGELVIGSSTLASK